MRVVGDERLGGEWFGVARPIASERTRILSRPIDHAGSKEDLDGSTHRHCTTYCGVDSD